MCETLCGLLDENDYNTAVDLFNEVACNQNSCNHNNNTPDSVKQICKIFQTSGECKNHCQTFKKMIKNKKQDSFKKELNKLNNWFCEQAPRKLRTMEQDMLNKVCNNLNQQDKQDKQRLNEFCTKHANDKNSVLNNCSAYVDDSFILLNQI